MSVHQTSIGYVSRVFCQLIKDIQREMFRKKLVMALYFFSHFIVLKGAHVKASTVLSFRFF